MSHKINEAQLQQICFIYFHNNYPKLRGLLFHVDNNSIDARVGRDKRSLGVTAGVSDFLFIYKGTVYCIEMKTETGIQKEVQKEWQELVEGQGICYVIVRSLDSFINVIKAIVNE
jgi:hypothetical protein